MRFLVTRLDALHDTTGTISTNHHHINNSDAWPAVVEADSHEGALKQFYRIRFPGSGLPKNRPFLVVALHDPSIVEFQPIQDYTVVVRRI